MKNNNTFKRVAAGALAALSVVGYTLPANVGGFLTNTSILIAGAIEETYANTVTFAGDLYSSLISVPYKEKQIPAM